MGEQVAEAASKLIPLMLLLLAIFGSLIIIAIVLRLRLKYITGKSRRKRRASPLQMQPGDVITILGKTFHVKEVAVLASESGQGTWCWLEGESSHGRLNLSLDRTQATYFPGSGEHAGEEPFPERIEREQRTYTRQGEPVSPAEGWRIALYQGPDGRYLAVEVWGGVTTLWRGKEIPVEGIEILEEN